MRDVSFTSVRTLFRLDLKSRFSAQQDKNIKKQILDAFNVIFGLIVYAILILGIYYITEMFAYKLGYEYLVIATTLVMVVATIVATGNVIKNLYLNGDNEMLLRFPVSGKEIYIAKSLYCALHNLVVCYLLAIPFYLIFGIIQNAPVWYYFAALGVIFLETILPFAIAHILAVPAMIVMNFIKNKFLIVFIFTVVIIVAVFVGYMEILRGIMAYIATQDNNIFSPEMMEKFSSFAANAYPFNFYAELLYGGIALKLSSLDLFLRFLYIFLISAVLCVLAAFISTKTYYRTILYGIQNDKTTLVKPNTKNVVRGTFGTLFYKEFFMIFRSFNYSFQYFAMAIAAPIMAYYCNELAVTLGTQTIGADIVPGLTLMVIIIFVTIIVSFASTTVSREGNTFYQTKVIPVSYTYQVSVKFFMYWMVATISIILSCLIVGFAFGPVGMKENALLSPLDVGCIFIISELFTFALTSLSIWADVKFPTFNVGGDGELVAANKNVALSLLVGISFAVLFGLFMMLLTFLPIKVGDVVLGGSEGAPVLYGILIGISAIVTGISMTVLFVGLEKMYTNIVP